MDRSCDVSEKKFSFPPRQSGEVVLLVDDDPTCLHSVGDILERLGYTVVRQADARTACNILQEQIVHIDLVITDYRMEGMNGLELLHTLWWSGRFLPIIMLTGYDMLEVYLKANVQDYVYFAKKPIKLRDLDLLVRRALKKGKN